MTPSVRGAEHVRRYVQGLIAGLCIFLALAQAACTPASPTSLPSPATQSTAAGAVLSSPPSQTIPPEATVPPAPTGTAVSGTPTSIPTGQTILKPLAVASAKLGLGFDSWSPDSQWIAYWVGEVEPPAHLTFVNAHTAAIANTRRSVLRTGAGGSSGKGMAR